LIEDAAQAHGASRGKFKAGSIGEIACFSFFPTKVMTTAEGGMVVCNKSELIDKVWSLRNFGRDPNDGLLMINRGGSNHKMTEFQGLMGLLELKRVKKRIKQRTKLSKRYQTKLGGSSYQPIGIGDGVSCYYKQMVKTPLDQLKLNEYCKKQGVVLTGEVYRYPVHEQPIYRSRFNPNEFPVANYWCKHHICPPNYPELSVTEVDYVCDLLLRAEKELG